MLLVLLVCAGVLLAIHARNNSAESTTTPKATPRGAITIQAAGRGKQFFNFRDGRQTAVSYRGEGQQTLQSGQAQPRALTSAVLAGDAVPDLIAGYAANGTGVVTVQHGNPEAFAPKDESVYASIVQGYNPESLLPVADSYVVPESVDFLQAGDFNYDGRKDVLTAARGGDLFLLAGDGRGRLNGAAQVQLPGRVTAIAGGDFRVVDGWTDLAVGLETPSGPALLIFDGTSAFGDAFTFPLRAPATAMQFADLDHDPFQDLAVAAGDEVIIIHGWSRERPVDPQSRLQYVSLGSTVRDLAVGFFVWNRQFNNQVATLSDDGVITILDPGSDTRPYTPNEAALFHRSRIHKTSESVDPESLTGWQPADAKSWTSLRQVAVNPSLAVEALSRKVLMPAHISLQETYDLVMLDGNQRKLDILRQGISKDSLQASSVSAAGELATTSLDMTEAPAAFEAFPQKINGGRSLFVLQMGSVSPEIVPIVPAATPLVDRFDDPTPIPATCDADPSNNNCSLRGAVQVANGAAGSTITLPAGTYTLSLNGTSSFGCDNNSVGDLNIDAHNTTITGAGSGTTIIRQHGDGPAADGDRVICMNTSVSATRSYAISGVTIVGGRDSSTWTAGGIIAGGHDNSLTLTNVVMANNLASNAGTVNTGGGAIQVVGGHLTIIGSTIGGSAAPLAYDIVDANRDLTTPGNSCGVSGGGINHDPSSGTVMGTVGNLTVTTTTFNNNRSSSAAGGGGGLDINNAGFGSGGGGTGTMTLNNCTFSNNQATGAGNTGNGGAFLLEALNATINATAGATSFTSNTATNKGGAIANTGGALTLDGTSVNGITFSSNSATNGASSIFANNTTTLMGTNTTVGGSIIVATNGTWTNIAGSAISPTDFSILGGTLTCNNSTMNVTGNFTLGKETTKGGVVNANTGIINVDGNMALDVSFTSVSAGAFNANSGTVNLKGNLSVVLGTSPNNGTFSAGTGTFNFNGTAVQTITNSGTGTPITFNLLTDSNIMQTLNVTNSINVNNTLNVNGVNAILNPAAAAIIGGTGTLTGTGTARVTRTAATADFLSQYTITNKTLTNLTVEYIGGAAQVLSATTFGPLKINNGSGVNLSGTATVNGLLTLTTGALNVGASPATLNINDGSSVGAGTLASNATGTVVYGQTSAGQNVIAANYGHLTFSNFNKVLPAGTVGIAGTFTTGTAVGHTITGNTINFNGTGAQTVPAFNYNNLTISGARTTNNVTLVNGGTIGVAGTFSPTAIFTSGVYIKTNNTFDYNGAGAQTIAPFNYNNLTISGARGGATVTFGAGTVGIAGVFNPSATAVVYSLTGNTVEYNGTAVQTIPSGFTTYNNLTLNNAAGVTGFAGLTVNGLLRVQVGTFTSSSNYNNVQIDAGATLAGTNATTINVTGNWTNNGAFTANGNTVIFNGSSAQTIAGSSVTTFNNLEINNGNGVSLGNSANVGGALTLTNGVLGVVTNTLTLNGAVNITNGSIGSSPTGTVNYNQGSNDQNVVAGIYGNLTFSNFNKTLPAFQVSIAGTFTPGIATGHTITGNTINFNGTGAQTVPAFNYNNLTISGTRTTNNVTLVNGGTIGVAGAFSPTATFTSGVYIKTNNTFDYNGAGAQTIAAFNYNNLTISGARTTNSVTLVNGGTIGIAATFNPTASFTSGAYVITGNTVEYNGTVLQTLPSGFTPYNNLTLNNAGGTVGFAGLTVNGLIDVKAGTFTSSSTYNNVQVDSGGTLAGTNATTINVSGNWTINTGGAFTPNGNTVNFNGSGAQTIGGTATTAAATTFNNLTIANAGSGVTLGQNETVNGTLTLTNDLNTGAFTLTQPSSAPTTAGTGDVVGNFKRTNAPNPLPNPALTYGNLNNTIGFTAGTAPTDITIKLTKTAPTDAATGQTNSGWPGAILRTYVVTPTGGVGFSATMQLHYNAGDLNGNLDDATLKLFKLVPTGWQVQPTSTNNGSGVGVSLSGITGFSPWTMAKDISPSAADGNVSGQIVDGNGNPVEGAAVRMSGTQNRLTVTDAAGNYHFDGVETNGFYTVVPARANFSFSPAQRAFSQLGQHTDAAFSATSTGGALNPLDTTEYFVRQQYVDFLNREPDEPGFNFWVNNIETCGSDANCRAVKRIDTSAAFFLSIEFQQTGYLVYRTYQAAYGDLANAPVPVRLNEFKPDTQEIGNGVIVLQSGWEQKLASNKQAYMTGFVQRARFVSAYPETMTPAEFVDRLFTNAGVTPDSADRAAAINEFGPASTTSDVAARGRALRRVAENSVLAQQEFNQAFVLMEYFGYMRRDPDTGPDTDFTGYNFWLNKLNDFGGNYQNADMVKAFLVSGEYRGRFPR